MDCRSRGRPPTERLYSTACVLPSVPPDVLTRALSGAAVVYWHGQALPLRLRAAERREYERAKARGYVLCRGKRSNLAWAWGYWCENAGHPYVKLHFGPRYATVELDLIANDWRLSPAAQELLLQQVCGLVPPDAHKKAAHYSVGDVYSVFVGVRNDHAHLVAEAFLRRALQSKETAHAP